MQRYETHVMEQPELPFLYMNTFHCSPTHLSCICNWHENIEILIITEGNGTVRVNDETFPVSVGDLAVINAYQIHDIFSREKMRYACLIIDRSFFLQNYLDSSKIRFDAILRDTDLCALLKTFEEVFLSETEIPYRVPTLRSLALQIIMILCKKYSTPEAPRKTESKIHATIKKVIGKIRAESHTDISLDKIAKEEGWNKHYLAREFHRYTGQTLITFLNAVRCEHAKTLLRKNELSIGEIGRQCGFNDQTYFTRKFRSHTGKTPGEYRKNHVKK